MPYLRPRKLLFFFAVVLTIVVVFLATRPKPTPPPSPPPSDQDLIQQISRLIELPPDETPTVATITDQEKLKSQPFFARARNGDKVLIFSVARKAYIYRPETHKIIDVAPINISASPSASP